MGRSRVVRGSEVGAAAARSGACACVLAVRCSRPRAKHPAQAAPVPDAPPANCTGTRPCSRARASRRGCTALPRRAAPRRRPPHRHTQPLTAHTALRTHARFRLPPTHPPPNPPGAAMKMNATWSCAPWRISTPGCALRQSACAGLCVCVGGGGIVCVGVLPTAALRRCRLQRRPMRPRAPTMRPHAPTTRPLPPRRPLQDEECRRLVPGTRVIALCHHSSGQRKYYSATIAAARHRDHPPGALGYCGVISQWAHACIANPALHACAPVRPCLQVCAHAAAIR